MSVVMGQEITVSPTTDQERALLRETPQQAVVVNVRDEAGRVWVRLAQGGAILAVQPASVLVAPDYSIPVTYDQGEFHAAAEHIDWGVLVTDGQEGLSVYICAESPADAARHLRDAADAVEADERRRALSAAPESMAARFPDG